MPCGLAGDAELDILEHWTALPGARMEPVGLRADCPVCGAYRGLSVQDKGHRYPDWKNHCECDRSEVRAKLAAILPGCVSARYAPRHAADAEEIVALVLDRSVTINALRLGCLRALGMSEKEAKEKLALPRRTYYDAVRILAQNRRSHLVRILALSLVRILAQTCRSEGV